MSDGITEARKNQFQAIQVDPGNVYRHFKGNTYVVITVAKDSDDPADFDKRTVSYMNVDTGQIFFRNLIEFVTPKVLEDGTKQTRFKFVGRADVSITDRGVYSVTRKFQH